MWFRVLGPLEVCADGGEPVPVRAAKHRTLLTVLLLHANHQVSGHRLMAALWPDQPPRSATGLLRTYVSDVRHWLRLNEPYCTTRLVTQPGGYQLTVAPYDLDLMMFDDLSARGHHALDHGDAAEAAQLLGAALGLWRGEPAEGVALDGDTETVLTGLGERRVTAEEEWIDARLMLGYAPELVSRLRELVAEYPFREELHSRLMLALYRAGRLTEALDAFDRAGALNFAPSTR